MRKRLNRMLLGTVALAILSTAFLVTTVYYHLFQEQVFRDLQDITAVLAWEWTGSSLEAGAGSGEAGDFAEEAKVFSEEGSTAYEIDITGLYILGEKLRDRGIRLTWMDGGGRVIHDNRVKETDLENHLHRPEVQQAMETGEGKAVRKSGTLAHNTYYYALRLPDGGVLRTAKDAGNIGSIFISVFPSLLWILAALLLAGLYMACFLTEKLVAPIGRLAENMESDAESEADPGEYEELAPLIARIHKQHRDILNSSRMRQEFTANVSHELKTPLTAISGYAELIETGMALPEDVPRFARGIHSSADRLLALINDILRLSELEDGQDILKTERLELHGLASVCVEMLDVSARKRQVQLAVSGEECYVEGDRQMVEELLYNLCDNGIRYNRPGGTVEVKTYREACTGEVVLEVCDTGIGIPGKHQGRIFQRFYRVDKSRSQSTGGTGLGLAIVKHIVERHHARLELDSREGEGTRIKILFPGSLL